MTIKRSIYLINPTFQLKFSFFICSIVFITGLIYPISIYEILINIVKKTGDLRVIEELDHNKKTIIMILALLQIGLTAIIFAVCIFQSHKVAGPLYKLNSYFNKIKNGETPGILYFRRGDHFPELATSFNDSFGKIMSEYNNHFVYLSEINSYINNLESYLPDDKKVVIKEISQKLNDIQAKYNQNIS
jgi:hypothetical protein